MMAHEICQAPTNSRPSNDTNYMKPLRGFDITCRFRNGTEVTITTIAVNSSTAIQQLDDQFENEVDGYTVSTL